MVSHGPTAGLWRAVPAAVILGLVLGAWLAPVRAGDDDAKTLTTRINEHARRLTTYKQTRDVHALHDEIWRAPRLYRQVEDADACARLQAKLVRGIGSLCRHGDPRIRRCAVEALGAMRDEAGAKYLKPLIKPGTEKPADPLTVAAIESAGGVRHESLVGPLLKVVADCPCPLATRRAVESLGRYQAVKSKRETIVVDLIQLTLDEQDLERWQVLADALPGALNRLTGQDVATLDGWVALVAQTRDDLGSLFPKEDAGA